jgi:hypothetical protein
MEKKVFYQNYRLFKMTASDWWGEDKR